MFVIILGFRSYGPTARPEVIYAGNDQAEGLRLAEASRGFVRIGRTVNPPLIPCRIPEAEPMESKIAAEAPARSKRTK